MKKIAIVVAALLALPSLAGAQTPDAPDERIAAAKSQALEHGIPVSLLESKIAVGKAKGVSMDRIAEVVERRAAVLERAHDALSRGKEREQPDAGELSAGADALGGGVSEAVLAKIADAAPRDRRAVAIAALTELVAQGIVPERALEQVTAALARGPEALANLPAQAAAARERQGRPEAPGRPAEPGQGGGQGRAPQGPPAGVPAPGHQPETGKPATPGRPDGAGRSGR
jgi:hypothetical protein